MLIGCVVFKSQMEPELMGIPHIISGAGILINNFTMFRSGRFTNPLFTFLAIPIFIGEIPFCLWLYISGVDDLKINHFGDGEKPIGKKKMPAIMQD